MAWGLGGCGCGHTGTCAWCDRCSAAGKRLNDEEYNEASNTPKKEEKPKKKAP